MKRETKGKVQTWFQKVVVFPLKCLFYSFIYDKHLYLNYVSKAGEASN